MPSSQRKKRSALFDKSPILLGEVTVYDFADSSAPNGGRIKKAITSDFKIANCESSLEDGIDEANLGRRRRRRRRQSSCSSKSKEDDDIEKRPGQVYPIDIWFILSDYIRPQDVLNFSLLCKGSHHVVNTSKFWINLYNRYCRSESVSKKFGHECLEKRHGLKAVVVQALFLACPSLVSNPTPHHDPTSLSGFLCILMWIERSGLGELDDSISISSPKNWIYKFKLTKTQSALKQSSFHDKKLKSCSDINANPDEGCKILTVPCWDYTAVPCVSGMRLSQVKCNSMQLSLVFSTAPPNTSSSQMGNVFISLHPSNGPTVFDWWHPSYHNAYRPS